MSTITRTAQPLEYNCCNLKFYNNIAQRVIPAQAGIQIVETISGYLLSQV